MFSKAQVVAAKTDTDNIIYNDSVSVFLVHGLHDPTHYELLIFNQSVADFVRWSPRRFSLVRKFTVKAFKKTGWKFAAVSVVDAVVFHSRSFQKIRQFTCLFSFPNPHPIATFL